MTSARAFSTRVAIATALSLIAGGCGSPPGKPAQLDGVYRLTISTRELSRIDAPSESAESSGTWALVLEGRRFALTRESDQSCAWAYGALGLEKGNLMDWTVIDAGGVPPGAAGNQPRDAYRFRWSRYRDVLTLSPVRGGPAGYFAAKPWRRIADTATTKHLGRRCPPPAGALEPTGAERASPAPDTRLGFSGDLVRTGPVTWTGSVTSKQLGPGRLSIEGNVVFSPPWPRTRLTFAARFSVGELRGCSINAIMRRPHARFLWDGSGGQITGTSPGLRPYLGLPVGIHGVTMTNGLDRMHGGLEYYPAPQRRNRPSPRDLC